LFGQAGGAFAGVTLDQLPTLDLVGLDPANGFVIEGSNVTALLGFGIQAGFDYNGDGILDFSVRAQGADPNGATNAGESYVIYGKASDADWAQVLTLNADGVMSLRVYTLSPDDGVVFHGTVAGQTLRELTPLAADFNGDGQNDYLLTYNTGGYILFGSALPGLPAITDSAGREVIQLSGLIDSNTGINILGAVSLTVADVNGDGAFDIVSRVPTNTGAYVRFGTPGEALAQDEGGYLVLNLSELGYDVLITTAGNTNAQNIGVGVNDYNGDGIADIQQSSAASYGGKGGIAVYYGREGADWGIVDPNGDGNTRIVDWATLPLAADGFTVVGANVGDGVNSISILGDVNGDGRMDIYVGAPGYDGAGGANTNSGVVYIVLGQPDPDDESKTVYGKIDSEGLHRVLDLANFQVGDGIIVEGMNAGDALRTAAAADLNGDGSADLLFGAFNSTLGGVTVETNPVASGAVFVIYGSEALGGIEVGAGADDSYVTGSNAGDRLSNNGYEGALMFGFGGNDVFVLTGNTDFARIDGGDGIGDTLILSGSGMALDLTALAHGAITSIEEFDLGVGAANTGNQLTIGLQDVFALSANRTIQVRGDDQDTVNASGFTQQVNSAPVIDGDVTYDVWTAGAGLDVATLLIQQGIVVNV
jgi:hypothetical protein